jgi:hypothetical protein
MINDRGEALGRVNDVLYGDESSNSPWAVVGTGWFGTERFVPLHGAYLATDGKVVVPYDKSTVKHAPRAGDHALVPAVRAALAAYYGA